MLPRPAPLDIFGQPVKNTKPVGPRKKVYHRADTPAGYGITTTTGTTTTTTTAQSSTGPAGGTQRRSPSPPALGASSSTTPTTLLIPPEYLVDRRTNTTWYMQRASEGAFRMKGLNKHWYAMGLVPEKDPRNSEKMGAALIREQRAIREGVVERMTALSADPERALALGIDAVGVTKHAKAPPSWIDQERAILRTRAPLNTVGAILHAEDKEYVDTSPIRNNRARIIALERAKFEFDAGLSPTYPTKRQPGEASKPPGIDDFGRPRKTTTVETLDQPSADIKAYEKQAFAKAQAELSKPRARDAVDCRGPISLARQRRKEEREAQHNPDGASSVAPSSSVARGGDDRGVPLRGHHHPPSDVMLPEALSPVTMPSPVWATVMQHHAFPFQKQAAHRRYCDEKALQAAVARVEKGGGLSP